MPQTSLRITGHSSGSKVDKLGLGLPWLLGYGVSVWGAYPEHHRFVSFGWLFREWPVMHGILAAIHGDCPSRFPVPIHARGSDLQRKPQLNSTSQDPDRTILHAA